MSLIFDLTELSNITIFIILALLFILFSAFSVYIVRRVFHKELAHKYNTIVGNVGALISIIYGVLIGLMALYLLNNINYTSEAVLHEANAVADIYRGSKWLNEPTRGQVQTQIKMYLEHVINIEWPKMRKGQEILHNESGVVENITDLLVNYKTSTEGQTLVIHDMFDEVRALYDARQQRIEMSYAALDSGIWSVILVGTLLIILLNFFYDLNLYVHIALVSTVALMSASMIFLLITLDKPFQGEFVIEPTQFKQILDSMTDPINAVKISPITPNLSLDVPVKGATVPTEE